MKHLKRWLICLSFILNLALFVTLVVLGIVKNPIFLAVSLVTYPLSILIIALARKHINSKCYFYWRYDEESKEHIAWKIIKTLLMPIVACGALIMYHLVSTTYRKMNEAIEDKTGFSCSSILRTLKALPLFVVACLICYAISMLFADENSQIDNLAGGLLIFGGIVWLIDHILWDIMDFAQKESDSYIKVKNVIFTAVAVLCAVWGIIAYVGINPDKKVFGDLVGQAGVAIAPLAIHAYYYGIIRAGRVPQSKMVYFHGPIAVASAFVFCLLVGLVATVGKVFVLLFHIAAVIGFGAVIFFFGFPFFYSAGEYRSVYRQIAKAKRLNRMREAKGKATRNEENKEVYDVVSKATKSFGLVPRNLHISAIAEVQNIKVFASEIGTSYISYEMHYSMNIDLRGLSGTQKEQSLASIERDTERKLDEIKKRVVAKTCEALKKENIPVTASGIIFIVTRDRDRDYIRE